MNLPMLLDLLVSVTFCGPRVLAFEPVSNYKVPDFVPVPVRIQDFLSPQQATIKIGQVLFQP